MSLTLSGSSLNTLLSQVNTGIGNTSMLASQLTQQPLGLATAMFRNARMIGTIIPDVVVEETGTDDVVVTQHPVANNTPISDHKYKNPCTLTMRVGWSESPAIMGGGAGTVLGNISSTANSFTTNQRTKAIYQQMQDLQNSPNPFQVTTGKRVYDNMVITSIAVTTEQHTEFTLLMTVTMQQIVIVTPQTVVAPPQSAQSNPAATGGTTDNGSVQPQSSTTPDASPMYLRAGSNDIMNATWAQRANAFNPFGTVPGQQAA